MSVPTLVDMISLIAFLIITIIITITITIIIIIIIKLLILSIEFNIFLLDASV